MRSVRQVVTELSGRRNKECYYILCCAVESAVRHAPKEPPMKTILADVSEMTGKENTRSISKALSRAVDDIWEYGDRKKLEEIYGRPIAERPTPKELVYRLAIYVRSGAECLVSSDPASGAFGAGRQEDLRQDFAAVCPYTHSYSAILDFVSLLNDTDLPIQQFMAYCNARKAGRLPCETCDRACPEKPAPCGLQPK